MKLKDRKKRDLEIPIAPGDLVVPPDLDYKTNNRAPNVGWSRRVWKSTFFTVNCEILTDVVPTIQ